jgi:MiaB/RimO family radical SAM methylthiotransferase
MKSIFLFNDGTCVRVELFGLEVKKLFEANGWQAADSPRAASLIIVNTCSFLKSREDFFMDRIATLHSTSTSSQTIAVIGCLPALKRAELLVEYPDLLLFDRDLAAIKQYFVLSAMPKIEPTRISERLTLSKTLLHCFNRLILKSPHIDYRLKRDKVCYLQISTGCLGRCTYCSERLITKLKSNPIKEIAKAVQSGIDQNYTLFGLSSDDASAYGRDIDCSLDDLLEALIKIDAPIHFNLPECNPQGLTDRVMQYLESPKFLYITIPIQSGSQRILDSMARPYEIADVVEKVHQLRTKNPGLLVNTHIIVGFPGETEDDFEKTKSLLETGIFDRVKIFMYSPRPGTPAANFAGQIDEATKQNRRKVLLKTMHRVNLRQRSLVNLILNKEQLS